MLVNQPFEQKKFQIQPNEQESKCLGFKDEQTLSKLFALRCRVSQKA